MVKTCELHINPISLNHVSTHTVHTGQCHCRKPWVVFTMTPPAGYQNIGHLWIFNGVLAVFFFSVCWSGVPAPLPSTLRGYYYFLASPAAFETTAPFVAYCCLVVITSERCRYCLLTPHEKAYWCVSLWSIGIQLSWLRSLLIFQMCCVLSRYILNMSIHIMSPPSPECWAIQCITVQAVLYWGAESFALLARSQLPVDRALSCVISRYLTRRWVFSVPGRSEQ